jgi:hypothetical protein
MPVIYLQYVISTFGLITTYSKLLYELIKLT